MTPQHFQIGQEVEIIGPDILGNHDGEGKIAINMLWQKNGEIYYSAEHMSWYPASSLRLVEELKVGDWVEVIGPSAAGTITQAGFVGQITGSNPWGPHDTSYALKDIGYVYLASSLRKLTPEEVAMHTGTVGYKWQEYNDEMETAMETLRELLAPLVDERLSCIEKQQGRHFMESLDVDKRIVAIEKLQEQQQEKINQFDGEIGSLRGSIQECLIESGDVEARTKCREMDINKRLSVLEGERPEVCDRQPGTESIRVSIQRGNDPARIFVDNCSFGCLIWAKKVLNGMREA